VKKRHDRSRPATAVGATAASRTATAANMIVSTGDAPAGRVGMGCISTAGATETTPRCVWSCTPPWCCAHQSSFEGSGKHRRHRRYWQPGASHSAAFCPWGTNVRHLSQWVRHLVGLRSAGARTVPPGCEPGAAAANVPSATAPDVVTSRSAMSPAMASAAAGMAALRGEPAPAAAPVAPEARDPERPVRCAGFQP